MKIGIPSGIKKLVAERAEFRCEYCLMTEEDSFFSFQIDHIISLKHNGKTELNNLAYSYFPCNARKGSNISTLFLPDQELYPLFNPRTELWKDHFEFDKGWMVGKSKIGLATIQVLGLNSKERLAERILLGF